MKVSVAALAVLIGTTFCSLASTQTMTTPMNSVNIDPCCFAYTSRQIPRIFVVDYYVTSSKCSQPGIVFITKKGREICVNPTDTWVKEYVNHLDRLQ
ncbi:C-C motif chemokine 4-like [Emydura macquarii macquarii]|uniref:C-C motif chemokine 4-like n=1 Tax=Emydura macquarii macquarii TaxID=1129001 RepID=UPI003529DA2F